MLAPFISFSNPPDFIIGIWLHAGQNPWYTWLVELNIAMGWWEISLGLRYKKVY
jgi:hypothetical protein